MPPRARPTIPGLAEARHVVVPAGITSSGYPSVRATCEQLGIGHDSWQQGVGKCVLAKGADGDYAADTVVMSIARQVGKTYIVGTIVFADCINVPGTTVVWTAHRFKVARESFDFMRALATGPKMAPHVDPDQIYTAAGNEQIKFRNGSRILFAARERGAIRGVAKVRRLVLDEGQILSESAMSDLLPTMNQAVNPQVIVMGTPPRPQDPSEVFQRLRAEALDGESDDTVYVEFSAPDGSDLDDVTAWHAANPSLGVRTPYKALRRLRKTLSDDDFAREALGIWDGAATQEVIDSETWRLLGDSTATATVGQVAYAVDVSPDQSRASIGMAAWRPDGRRLVEWVETRQSVDWVVDVAAKITAAQKPAGFVIDTGAPAGALIGSLRKAGVTVIECGLRAYANACGTFYNESMGLVDDSGKRVPLLVHLNQPILNASLAAARKRKVGDEGAWAWSRKHSAADITPIVACTLAIHGLGQPAPKKPSTMFAF